MPLSREPLSRDREGAVTAPKHSAAPGPKIVTERAVKPLYRGEEQTVSRPLVISSQAVRRPKNSPTPRDFLL